MRTTGEGRGQIFDLFKRMYFMDGLLIFRCMNTLALSWTLSIFSLYLLFISICFFVSFNNEVMEGGGRRREGRRWSSKSEQKWTGGEGAGVKPLCKFTLWKKCLIFQTENRVPSDKLLGSSYMFLCFELSPAFKGVFSY